MNRGILSKSIREVWLMTLSFAVALGVIEMVMLGVFAQIFEESAGQLLQLPFVQAFLRGLLGTQVSATIGPNMISSFAWIHPIVLALLWTHEITLCTRMPAGEIDRGTIDMLLSLPVSRMQVFATEVVVWLAAGFFILAVALAGHLIGGRIGGAGTPGTSGRSVAVVLNLYCLYLAVGGVAWLVSSLSDRRGRAVAVVFGIVIISFFLDFLAQFWAPAGHASFLSLLHYYRPLVVVQDQVWPIADMVVLAGVGVATTIAAGVVFTRRDICTV